MTALMFPMMADGRVARYGNRPILTEEELGPWTRASVLDVGTGIARIERPLPNEADLMAAHTLAGGNPCCYLVADDDARVHLMDSIDAEKL